MAYVVTSPTTVTLLQRAAALAYQGQNATALQLLHANGLSYDDLRSYLIAKHGVSSLGSIPAAPVPASAAPADTSSLPIADQLNQVRVDWTTGTLYVGTNHYSLLTTFLGGMVIKGLFWGTGKLTDRISSTFASEKPATKKNPIWLSLLGGGAAAVGEHVTAKALKGRAKRHRRRS